MVTEPRSGPYWNREVETLPDEERLGLQHHKLLGQLDYVNARSPFYQLKFREAGVSTADDVASLDDLSRVPFTTKEELRKSQEESPPWGLHLAADPEALIRTNSTSGTTGQPVYQADTRRDVANHDEMIARALWAVGVRPGDRVINCYSLSMFRGGVPHNHGIERLGAVAIPVGADAGSERLLRIAQDTRATVLFGTPSYVEYLAERVPEVLGIDASELGIRIITGGGESGFEDPRPVRAKLEDAWGIEGVFDLSGSSDSCPIIFANCHVREGKHDMTPDLGLLELIDPGTGEPVEIEDGAEGEYVFTHLEREACPLIRYRSGDRISVHLEPCECGRTGIRVRNIGRVDDMLIVRGINVYPVAVKALVCEFAPRTTGHVRLVLGEEGPEVSPPIKVEAEYGAAVSPGDLAGLKQDLEEAIRRHLHFKSEVSLLPAGSLERFAMKASLVTVDLG